MHIVSIYFIPISSPFCLTEYGHIYVVPFKSFSTKQHNTKNCPKNMWQCVKNIESKSVNNEINKIKLENEEITSNKQKISDLFATHLRVV